LYAGGKFYYASIQSRANAESFKIQHNTPTRRVVSFLVANSWLGRLAVSIKRVQHTILENVFFFYTSHILHVSP
jgi:hypothetical protein